MELSADLEIIAINERELQFRSFSAAVVVALGVRLRELAVSRNASVVIDVRGSVSHSLRRVRRNLTGQLRVGSKKATLFRGFIAVPTLSG